MNKEKFEGDWKQLKGTIKEKWGQLTDNDVTKINGRYEKLLGFIQEKYGIAKEKAEAQIKEWKSKSKNK
jgi:uncharacterized protein YjbJ (UPF0337 family)